MTTYYVDFVNGSDANNGLGPDASHASNKPWKTIGKLVGASGMASGDTAYLSPAGPFRETNSFTLAPTAETKILGDPWNQQGFKTSGGVTVNPGEVIVTAFTTNDTTTAASASTLNLNGKNFYTIQYLTIQGGIATPSCINFGSTAGTNINIRDCTLIGLRTQRVLSIQTVAGTNHSIVVERCFMVSSTANAVDGLVEIICARHTADYNVGITVQNSILIGGGNTTFLVLSSGAGTGFGGGTKLLGCTLFGALTNAVATGANLSTTIPIVVSGCLLIGIVALNANTSGHISEDHNMLVCTTSRTNVTAGTGSNTGPYDRAPLLEVGQALVRGLVTPRPFLTPSLTSPAINYGTGSGPATDLYNNPRPLAGTAFAAGALERTNTPTKETSTTHTGSAALKFTGPGIQDFLVPVDAASTTLSIYARYDSTYAGTRPQIVLLENPAIGVATQTVTATTGALNAWEQVSLAAFTPSAKGVVKFRVVSNDTNGAGAAFFDTFASA